MTTDAEARSQVRPARARSVLLVANYAPDVGFAWWLMENFWIQLATLAERRGLHPMIAYPSPGELPSAIRDAGIETVVQAFPGSGLAGLRAALDLVRRTGARYVYFTDRPFTSLAYVLLRLWGVKVIVNHDHIPGDRPPVRGLRGALKAAWRRLPWLSCDLQLCVSPLTRKRAISSARIPPRKAVVVQNGIEPIECADGAGYAQRALGLPEDARICITVGRAHPNKRIDLVIEAARHAFGELDVGGLHFVHCGDGPELPRLEKVVADAGLTGRFIFAGRRSDVRELLCSSDIAMHAAKGEAFSLAILEYMSAGLAVLVPDIPTVSQAIRHDETGLVYRDGDTSQAAALIAELCADPSRRSRLGAAAAHEVRERYSFSRMNEAFRQVASASLESI